MKRSFFSSLAFLLFMVAVMIGAGARISASGNKDASPSQNIDMKISGVPDIKNSEPASDNITGLPAELTTTPVIETTGPLTELTVTPVIEITMPPAEASVTPAIEVTKIPSEPTDAPAVITEAVTIEPTQAPVEGTTDTPGTNENNPVIDNNFYFVYFDVLNEGNVKASIPSLIVRFRGTISSIDPADLTEIVLTRDGVPVDNSISLSDKINQFKWGYEDVTDFYFNFNYENREPGNYGLTGKYKGSPFTVYNKILENPVSDAPANANDLTSVGWGYYPDESNHPQRISELSFNFSGNQNAFYQSDLTELKVTLDGQEIAYSFREYVMRYLEYSEGSGGNTSFNLILNEEFTESGNYVITGKYQGTPFTSQEISIP